MPQRTFAKSERTETFSSEGSIRLTDIEKAAYFLAVDIEILGASTSRYQNYKINPPSTHWGYCSVFSGASVRGYFPVNFALARVYEGQSPETWLHFQLAELETIRGEADAAGLTAILKELISEFPGGETLVSIWEEAVVPAGEFVAGVYRAAWRFLGIGEDVPEQAELTYTAMPVRSPHPTVIKFLSDIPLDFRFRLQAWHLINPVAYITGTIPVDGSDATDGEDEDRSPDGEIGRPYSDPDPDSDPDDFDGTPGVGFNPIPLPGQGTPTPIGEPGDPWNDGQQVVWDGNLPLNGGFWIHDAVSKLPVGVCGAIYSHQGFEGGTGDKGELWYIRSGDDAPTSYGEYMKSDFFWGHGDTADVCGVARPSPYPECGSC